MTPQSLSRCSSQKHLPQEEKRKRASVLEARGVNSCNGMNVDLFILKLTYGVLLA